MAIVARAGGMLHCRCDKCGERYGVDDNERGMEKSDRCGTCRKPLEKWRSSNIPQTAPSIYAGMPYAEYLQTLHWQEMRRRALEWAKYACQLCNAKDARLDVHHRDYSCIGSESLSDVFVLCDECHTIFSAHGKLKG